MKRDYSKELAPEVREKMKKNLVYVGIFSIVMMFAGFTSAYIVSMGDSFWLKYPLPSSFWISTAVIVLSSLFLELGIRAAKRDALGNLKLFMALTFLSGLSFIYFQFKGYGQLVDFGAHASNNHIIVTDGKYGDYYEIKMNGKFVDVNGNDYLLDGKKISEEQMKSLQNFTKCFLDLERNKPYQVVGSYGKEFILYHEAQPLGLINGKLTKPDGKELQYVDLMRLRDLAVNIRDSRGDFFVKGEMGKDFHIYFKGKELEYKNRELHYEDKKLSRYLQIKAMETADTSTSYLYIITFLHLLHILVTMIYMTKMTIGSFSGRFNSQENLSLRLGAIFWHFLGLLWLYLLLFLLFIH
jgi:cytochrome c oxidase subunit 3